MHAQMQMEKEDHAKWAPNMGPGTTLTPENLIIATDNGMILFTLNCELCRSHSHMSVVSFGEQECSKVGSTCRITCGSPICQTKRLKRFWRASEWMHRNSFVGSLAEKQESQTKGLRDAVVEAWQTSCRRVAEKLFKVGRKVASAMLQHTICSLCLYYVAPFHLFTHSEIIMKSKMLASTQAWVTNNEKHLQQKQRKINWMWVTPS